MSNLIGQSLGRYHILEQLGEGGMATVYKAHDTQAEREVAVKIIRRGAFPPDQLERVIKRFEREAKALEALSHSNIVRVVEYGKHEDEPYLVMEYIPSGTLKQKLGKPIPWREALGLLILIAKALEYAHKQGIIHRDVKPSNILMTQTGKPMLTDFGIAKVLDENDGVTLSTTTGVGIGTPEYMSPEQGLGQNVDARADIYSLGIVLYEMLTGRKPFSADTPMAVIVKHINDPLPRPSKYAPGLPNTVENLILKALAKKPESRYQNMKEFVSVMEKLVAGRTLKPSQTMPGSEETVSGTFYSGSRFSARIKGWLVAGMLILTSLVGLIGWMANKGTAQAVAPTVDLIFTSALQTAQSGITQTAIYGVTALPAYTVTPITSPTPLATATSKLGIGSTIIGNDGMTLLYVPEGEFIMGSNSSESGDNLIHKVILDAFWIDQTEVTNTQYATCVSSGGCIPPSETSSFTRSNYYGNSQFDDYPVIYVNWNKASAYCSWVGRRLPTEAEWEKAARGTDGRAYPWGNDWSNTDSLVNSGHGVIESGDTTKVGNYKSGASPYGAYDMAGNVWEWVNDWYSKNYYQSSPSLNPLGPDSGQYRILRGGSWYFNDWGTNSAVRNPFDPTYTGMILGFRCAQAP